MKKQNEKYLEVFEKVLTEINKFNKNKEIKEIKNFFDVPSKHNNDYEFYKEYQLIKDKNSKVEYFFPRNTNDLCFFNKKNPTYYCLNCDKKLNHLAGNSHSVSKGHIKQIQTTIDQKIYGFRDSFFYRIKDLFNNIEYEGEKLILKKSYNIEDAILYDFSKGSLSIFPGFCKSIIDCDGNLFKILDGVEAIDFEKLKYEIMYRTVTWKLLKTDQESIFISSLRSLYFDKPLFKEIYDNIILKSITEINNQIEIENFNELFNSIENKLSKFDDFYLKLKNKDLSLLNKFNFKMFEIEKTDYIGINYFNEKDSQENKYFFDTINKYSSKNINEFFTGILYFKDKCYGFFIYDQKDESFFTSLIKSQKAREKFIKKALIEINNTNTFINSKEKENTILTLLGFKQENWEKYLKLKLKFFKFKNYIKNLLF